MVDQKQNNEELTDAEAELYDRQIRLWGLESQKRLRASKVLLIGLNGLGAEVAKNVILAGVKSVTFLDHRAATLQDGCAQFLVPKEDIQIGKNRAEASLPRARNLNPMVEVNADLDNVDDKPDEYFKQFNIVCATNCTITQLKRVSQICHIHNIKFFAGDVWGLFGYVFVDLQKHEYIEEVPKQKRIKIHTHFEGDKTMERAKYETIMVNEKRIEKFVPFECILNIQKSFLPVREEMYYYMLAMLNYREKYGDDPLPNDEENLKNLIKEFAAVTDAYELTHFHDLRDIGDVFAQLSPACSIIGGIITQEIIKAASHKHTPINNLFTFHPYLLTGAILRLGMCKAQ